MRGWERITLKKAGLRKEEENKQGGKPVPFKRQDEETGPTFSPGIPPCNRHRTEIS